MAYIDKDALRRATFISYKEEVTKGRLKTAHVEELFGLVDKIMERYEDWKFPDKGKVDKFRKAGAL